jgi:effector-binding domain-containing protein
MIDAPRITQLERAPTAIIRLTIPREKMTEVMGPAIEEVMTTLARQGIAPAGAVFAHHLSMDPLTFDFEVGVPVARPITAAGRVQPGERPAVRVAQTAYHGPYEGLPQAWGEFHAWIEAEGHEFAPDVWECYAEGPQSDADPAKWCTELIRPLAG